MYVWLIDSREYHFLTANCTEDPFLLLRKQKLKFVLDKNHIFQRESKGGSDCKFDKNFKKKLTNATKNVVILWKVMRYG